jgi:hypothetical protein
MIATGKRRARIEIDSSGSRKPLTRRKHSGDFLPRTDELLRFQYFAAPAGRGPGGGRRGRNFLAELPERELITG